MKAYWDSLTKEQQGELAGKVGSTPGYLRLVFNGYKKASFVLAKKLEQCTSGAITKSDLRPDNQHAKQQIALESQRTQEDIKVAVANDDCASRPVPAAAADRLRKYADSLRTSSGDTATGKSDR